MGLIVTAVPLSPGQQGKPVYLPFSNSSHEEMGWNKLAGLPHSKGSFGLIKLELFIVHAGNEFKLFSSFRASILYPSEFRPVISLNFAKKMM